VNAVVVSSNFLNNRAEAGWGGAVRDVNPEGRLSVENSFFSTNTARDRTIGSGGAIFATCSLSVSGSGAPTGSVFTGNGGLDAASRGGAIMWFPVSQAGVPGSPALSVTNTWFVNNRAVIGGALAIFENTASNITTETVTGCLFSINRVVAETDDDGANAATGGGLFVSNTATGDGSASLTVTNCTFYQNQSSGKGGGLSIRLASGGNTPTSLTSLTVTQNYAAMNGGGAWVSGPGIGVDNSIFAGNYLEEGAADNAGYDVFGTVASTGYNLVGISDGSTGWLVFCVGPDLLGDATVPLAVGLDPNGLQANGRSPTRTVAVPATSPAYQTGDPGLLASALPPGDVRGTDQRGLPRNGPGVTIGAYDPGNRPNAPNNAPVGGNNGVALLENGSYTFAASDFGFTDPNNSPANGFAGVLITTLPCAGTLYCTGVPATAGQFVTAADIAAGSLVYNPATYGIGTAYDSFTFQVRNDGGTANGGVDTDPVPKTMTLNVSWVNQPPVGHDNTVSTQHDTPYVFAAADFGFSDPNNPTPGNFLAVEITTLPITGTLTLNGVAVSAGEYVSIADINAGNLVFTPDAGATGAPYASFTFQVQNDGGTANGGIDTDLVPRTMTIDVN
jgi:hypothetical protein